MASSIVEQIERLRAIFASHGFAMPLAAPATPAQIRAVEAETSITLDEALREFYELTDGSAGAYWLAIMTDELTRCSMLSLSECLSEWRQWLYEDEAAQLAEWGPTEPGRDSRIRPEFFVWRGWLPIADFNGGGTKLFFDADPAPGGIHGQMIVYQHDPDAVYWRAASFLELLTLSNDLLEAHFEELMFVDGEPVCSTPLLP